jgi:hypothetical protein
MMDKNKLINMAENQNNIPGIYNYCDRWCERCQFTSRCLNFQMSEEMQEGKEINDMNNEDFWKHMEQIFAVTREMLDDMAKEHGIDLSQIEWAEEDNKRERDRKESAEKHPCAVSSKDYYEIAERWFKENEYLFKEKEDELNEQLFLDLPSSNPEKVAVTLKDAIEVITFYLLFIHVKIMRALHGKLEDKFEFPDDMPKDHDGSAKIALIAIDRSISAWGKLIKHIPKSEDEILDILVLLERLRNMTEKEFPDARSFIHPGFDE